MTQSVERRLQDVFREDAEKAPQPADLAQLARRRAGAQRRRAARRLGTVLAVAGGVVVAVVARGPLGSDAGPVRPAVSPQPPVVTGPLTPAECPSGVNGGTAGFSADPQAGQPPAEDQARTFGARIVRPQHPEAVLVAGPATAERKLFLYVLPDGRRVARIEFERLEPSGWNLLGHEHC